MEVIQKEEVKCEIYIEYDKDLFDYLYKQKEILESECNMAFNWISLDKFKHAKIEAVYNIDTSEESNWEESINWQINVAEKFNKKFLNRIKNFYK